MTKVVKENIIIPAWNMMKDDTGIKKLYFFPWVLSIIFLTALLVYQFIYTYVVIFEKKDDALVILLNFFHSDYLIEVIINSVIFLIIYLLVTPIFEWWLIKYIDSKYNWEENDSVECLGLWVYKFFPLFE